MASASSMLLRLLRWLLMAAVGLVLLIAVLVGIGTYLNDRAHDEAVALCARIVTGSTETAAVALARETRARHLEAQAKHTFRFVGWVFNATDCEIEVEDGRVKAARIVSQED